MGTIPISLIDTVIPGVLAPAGNALDTIGLMLSTSRRVPIGTIQGLASAAALTAFFGGGSVEAGLAPFYYDGFVGADAAPGSLLAAQYPAAGAAAWLQGGNVSALTLPQLKGIAGTLTVVVDGYTYSSSGIDLSAATSFTSAAGIIQTDLNTSLPTGASVTAAIAAETASVTASIAGNVMTVTHVASGILVPGAVLSGTGVTSGTQIVNQLSGTPGGIGTYAVSLYQSVASESISSAYGTMTVTAVGSGTLSIGQTLSGSDVTNGTQITGLGNGTGGTGTYYVVPTQSVMSEAVTATGSALTVAFDSTSGGFLITSGQSGAMAWSSTAAFATGTTAASLALTAATGATLSQGSLAQTPGAFMTALAALNQDWFSFFTAWDPDDAQGAIGQNAQKLAFSTWTSQQPNTPFAFICEDTDISPSTTVPASSSMGAIIKADTLSGTCLIWNPNGATTVNANPYSSRAAFVSGSGGSVNFEELNGRITFAFKNSPAGLAPDVTSEQVAVNLAGNPQNAGSGQPVGGNGYNYYGTYANAAQTWTFFYPGSVSGPFAWLDAYLNQAYFNAQMQSAVIALMTTIKSFPYNPQGYALLEASLLDVINQMIDFGAIAQNVPLSASQAAQVNIATGVNAAQILSTRGWYLQIRAATASVRAARGAPPAVFYYTDGGSIQSFALQSIDVQ